MNFKAHDFGFLWGPVYISRVTSDDKNGWVVLELNTNKNKLSVYVTKSGEVRITDQVTGEQFAPVNSKKQKDEKYKQNEGTCTFSTY